jgi:hypothetical protein
MSGSKPPVLDDRERDQMRRWLRHWREAAPLLEQDRVAGIQALTDADAARIACDLWLWARPGGGDDAEGLMAVKQALRKQGDQR